MASYVADLMWAERPSKIGRRSRSRTARDEHAASQQWDGRVRASSDYGNVYGKAALTEPKELVTASDGGMKVARNEPQQ
jgi:hypothetical protein